MSQLRPQKVIIDGEVYPKEQILWEIRGKEYRYEEMKDNSTIHWNPLDTAAVKIYKDGGLEPGYHEISMGYKYSSSYMPPNLQRTIDREEPDEFLAMMFGQLNSTRKLLLVF